MSETSEEALLDELAAHCGIASAYYDNWGRQHQTSAETKRGILAAMGHAVGTGEVLREAVQRCRDAPWRQACEPVLVWRHDQPSGQWSFRLPVEESEDRDLRIVWKVFDEQGALQRKAEAGPGMTPAETTTVDGRRHIRLALPIPDGLAPGYYDLVAQAKTQAGEVTGTLRLILVPSRCHVPQRMLEGERIWGLALQLYALRSTRNWGVGDLGDLARFVERAAGDLGVGVVGINPLHALKNTRPYHISPYSPDSRLFLNVLYIAVEQIPDLIESEPARAMLHDPEFRAVLDQLRASEMVEYDRVYAAKLSLLERLFRTFQERHFDGTTGQPRTERGRAFADYLQREGDLLERFALFQVLSEEMRKRHPDVWVWQDWPEAFRDPASREVAAFRTQHAPRIRFHQYLQWVVGEQLGKIAARTQDLHMPMGLYHDLAIGCDRSGADAWIFQDVLALQADSGCPPDAFARDGQNWGFPPMDPHRLRASRYRLFVELLRKNLAYGGALRLDHVMGLFRLFWIPRGVPTSSGAYVAYPQEDLLGILALESVRHRAVVVGEDLGTVPDEVRERLTAAGVLSYRVLYFERHKDGAWKAPGDYPSQAVAVITTHDLPTLTGFWTAADLDVRSKQGMFADEEALRQALVERDADRRRLMAALLAADVLPPELRPGSDDRHVPAEMTPALRQAIHLFLARSPSWVVLAMWDDLLGESAQMNLPGTVDSYPNWSRKHRIALEEVWDSPDLKRLAAEFGALRQSKGKSWPR